MLWIEVDACPFPEASEWNTWDGLERIEFDSIEREPKLVIFDARRLKKSSLGMTGL
jgi:hypothetical protein